MSFLFTQPAITVSDLLANYDYHLDRLYKPGRGGCAVIPLWNDTAPEPCWLGQLLSLHALKQIRGDAYDERLYETYLKYRPHYKDGPLAKESFLLSLIEAQKSLNEGDLKYAYVYVPNEGFKAAFAIFYSNATTEDVMPQKPSYSPAVVVFTQDDEFMHNTFGQDVRPPDVIAQFGAPPIA